MEKSQKALIDNGIDFLEKSLNEFKDSPKYSILHFAIAVEILLKARLAKEHWSLIVQNNPNKNGYLNGDFVSVNLDETIKRLKDVVGENITEQEYRSFKRISAHRNKVIHFYHGEFEDKPNKKQLQNIVLEQAESWYHLKILFTKKWLQHFSDYSKRFNELELKMRRHWEYLKTIFDNIQPDLDQHRKKGKIIEDCYFCHFKAVAYSKEFPDYLKGNCLVCNWPNKQLTLKCDCENKITFQNEGWGTCEHCGKKYEPENVYELIDALGFDLSEWPDNNTPANCGYCEGLQTVAAFHNVYICCSCLQIFKTVGKCEWCNDNCTGNLDGSYWNGCVACEGKSGSMDD